MTTTKQRFALINSLCRVCGLEDGKCISIFGEEGKQQEIETKVITCLPLTVSETDDLPKQVCLTCLHKLDATWELLTLCKQGQILIADKLDGIVPRSQFNLEPEDNLCAVCNMVVQENQLGIGCDGKCRRWHHSHCINMSSREYISLVNDASAKWFCLNCKREQQNEPQTILANQVEKKMKELKERGSVSIGGSAVVFLAPASPEPPSEPDPPVAPAITSMVGGTDMVGMQGIMVSPGYLPAATVPTGLDQSQVVASAPVTEPVKNNVYPESLIQVNPTNKSVYQHRNRSPNENTPQSQVQRRPVPVPRRNPPAPVPIVKRKVPLSNRRGPVPKPMSIPAPIPRRRQRDLSSLPPSKRSNLICRYCNKSFPENIIDHHVNLHLRQSFQTCVECNKNFRSSEAMARHTCESTEIEPENPTIDLDADDD